MIANFSANLYRDESTKRCITKDNANNGGVPSSTVQLIKWGAISRAVVVIIRPVFFGAIDISTLNFDINPSFCPVGAGLLFVYLRQCVPTRRPRFRTCLWH